MEDVQFCGMYFCEEFFGRSYNDDVLPKDDCPKEEEEDNANNTTATEQVVVTISREERMKEMDDTFLGKVIQCGGCGDVVDDSCGGDYVLFRSDEGRDECSSERDEIIYK